MRKRIDWERAMLILKENFTMTRKELAAMVGVNSKDKAFARLCAECGVVNRRGHNRKNLVEPGNLYKVKCPKCPDDKCIRMVHYDTPPRVLPRIYCDGHLYLKNETSDATAYMVW